MSEEKRDFNFFEYHTQIAQDSILLSYKGPLTDILLSELSYDIRQKLHKDKKAGKKVFSIFMELSQNVLFYSKEMNRFGNYDKVGTLMILDNDEEYELVTGNLIYKKDVPRLLQKCEKINSMDRDTLREYKRMLRSGPSHEESKGAGIGLVQTALTSGNKLTMRIRELDSDYAFYVLFVKVKKIK